MKAAQVAWYEPFVAHISGVQGGEAILTGTRTAVRSVVSLYYEVLGEDVHRVMTELPHLSEAEVCAALAYYDAHRWEIKEARRQQDEAFEELVAATCAG